MLDWEIIIIYIYIYSFYIIPHFSRFVKLKSSYKKLQIGYKIKNRQNYA